MLVRRLVVPLAVGLATAPVLGGREPAPPPPLENPGFEAGVVGEPPPGWLFPSAEAGYKAEVTEETASEGTRSVAISWAAEGEPAPGLFGNLMRAFDAAPYRGKRVRFSAMVRTRGPVFADRAHLWLRVDRESGRGFFDNMNDRPIKTSAWHRYEIEGEVAADATTVNLGAFVMGGGKAWVDDVRFEVLGSATAGFEPPRALGDRALANLEALTRLLGYLRFFHPSDEAAAVDWTSLALAGVQLVEGAPASRELATALETLVRPVAPSVRLFPSGGPAPALPSEVTDPPGSGPARVVAWHHVGVGLGGQEGSYRSERRRFEDGRPVDDGEEPGVAWPGDPPVPAERVLTADLGGGVSARIPMALYVAGGETLPRPEPEAAVPMPDKPEPFRPSGDDRTTRLAGVVLAWPVLQHFYPYFDEVEVDWDAELRTALRAAAEDPGAEAYVATLRRMMAALQDGHAQAFHPELTAFSRLPLEWAWVEDALVVVGVGEGAPDGVAAGDVVVAVDGVPVPEALQAWEEQVSAATPAARRRLAAFWLLGDGEGTAVLTLATPEGERRDVTMERGRSGDERILLELRPEPVAELSPGVHYVDLTRVTEEEQVRALEGLAQAEAVVFDVRGYPRISTAALSRLIDEPAESPQWHLPVATRPDGVGRESDLRRWTVEPAPPRIRARVAFLTDERAISYAETYLGIVEHYRLGEIVGSPTAGTNGNVNRLDLPGGYTILFTGMEVLKHDGSRHHGVGIRPTVPAGRTLEGIRAGRDEVLERALEVVAPAASSGAER